MGIVQTRGNWNSRKNSKTENKIKAECTYFFLTILSDYKALDQWLHFTAIEQDQER